VTAIPRSQLVSVVIPTYNQHPAFLEAAIKSAYFQSWPDLEIVVVDDGSTPSQEEVIELCQRECPQPRVGTRIWAYEWQENAGVAGALNKAIKLAGGDWVAWLPSDDLFMADKTGLQMQEMGDHKISYTSYELGIPQAVETYAAAQYPSQGSLFEHLKKHCFINAATVMWHKSVFDKVGYYNPEIIHAQDYEFLLRCAEQYNFSAVAQPLVRRRIHEGQMINTLKTEEERLKKEADMKYLQERYGAMGHVWVPHGGEDAKAKTE